MYNHLHIHFVMSQEAAEQFDLADLITFKLLLLPLCLSCSTGPSSSLLHLLTSSVALLIPDSCLHPVCFAP